MATDSEAFFNRLQRETIQQEHKNHEIIFSLRTTPWFEYGRVPKHGYHGYLAHDKVQSLLQSLPYNERKLRMSKEQAFAGLVKPLLDNFDGKMLDHALNTDQFLTMLRCFYSDDMQTGYSKAFSLHGK